MAQIKLNPHFEQYVHVHWGIHSLVAQRALDYLTFLLGRVQTPEEKAANLTILMGLAESSFVPEAFLDKFVKLAQKMEIRTIEAIPEGMSTPTDH